MSDSFFDTYVDDSPVDSIYVTGEEKDALLASGDSFTIKAISLDPGDKYGERFLLVVEGIGEGERKLGFQTGTVDSRDRMLAAMAEFLAANPGTMVDAKLTSAGRATLITAA